MTELQKTERFSFSKMTLDRKSSSRKNNEWLSEQLKATDTKIILLYKGKFVFENSNLLTINYTHLISGKYPELIKFIDLSSFIFLGTNLQQAYFALDISSTNIEVFFQQQSAQLTLSDLRSSLAFLDPKQASILGFASNLSYWHRANRFCGFCGSKTQRLHGGHTVQCLNETCKKEFFPRTDPVVIMLIEHKPKSGPAMCLLAEHHRTPEKVVSTLAGFVDPAETLEQAVIREVKEEAGVNVSNVQYITSQPWPFPSSLMLGFHAQADDPTIVIDDDEIRDAKWFTAEQVRSFDNWGDEGDNYKLPRRESIARYLVDLWLEKNP